MAQILATDSPVGVRDADGVSAFPAYVPACVFLYTSDMVFQRDKRCRNVGNSSRCDHLLTSLPGSIEPSCDKEVRLWVQNSREREVGRFTFNGSRVRLTIYSSCGSRADDEPNACPCGWKKLGRVRSTFYLVI